MESNLYPAPHSYFEIKRIIRKLCAKYPFLEVRSLAKSAAGREVFSLSVGSEEENVLFVTGDDPAAPILTLIMLKFCEEICKSILKGKELCGLDMRKALFGRKITFVPLLNPDGAEIRRTGKVEAPLYIEKECACRPVDCKNWRSNLRGVEICRNFAYDFENRKKREKQNGIRHPSPFGFSGYSAESEAETIGLCKFCRENDINHLIHLSTFGQTVSYSALESEPKKAPKMAEIISAVSEYSICPPFAKADSYLTDWFTYEFSRPALCIKVGKEGIPNQNEAEKYFSSLKEALTLSLLF